MVNKKKSTPTSKESDDEESGIAEMCAAMDNLCCQNQTLEENVIRIQQCQQETDLVVELEILDPQPLSDEMYEAPIHENFKPPSLAKLDGRVDPYEHVDFINTKMIIIRAPNFLNYKLFFDTFRNTTFRWCMGLPKLLVTNYQDLVKKIVHQFSISKHQKLTTTGLFNIR